MAVPEAISFKEESEETKSDVRTGPGRYQVVRPGLSCRSTAIGERSSFRTGLSRGRGNAWDAHKDLKKNHGELAAQTDKPIAGLLRDLKQRGLLDETIVVWATEFGRTPGAEARTGAIIIRLDSRSGWPVEVSRAVLFMGRQMRSASMPSRTATM